MRVCFVALSNSDVGGVGGEVDGFSGRWLNVLRSLRGDHDVTALEICRRTGGAPPTWAGDVPVATVVVPFGRGSRGDRAARLVRRGLGPRPVMPWERRLGAALAAQQPDLVVLLTYRRADLARTIAASFPTVLFAEEEVAEGQEGWGTAHGLVGAAEAITLRRAVRRVAAVAVIGPRERQWAARTFGKPVVVVPHSLDREFWSAGVAEDVGGAATEVGLADEGNTEPPPVRDVFVIGNFSAGRNAEGLAAIARELSQRPAGSRPRLLVASATPPAPALEAVLGGVVSWLGRVDDPRPLYRSAGVTLVPAFAVSGVKTTVLQGWAMRCPVVATAPAAASVGGIDGFDLLAADNAAGVVGCLYRALGDEALRARLVHNGLRSLEARHGPQAVSLGLHELFGIAVATGMSGLRRPAEPRRP